MNGTLRQQVNRWLVGILAVACLVTGIAIGRFDSADNIWCGSFIRAGLLAGAFWVAMPTRGRAAAWADVSPYWIVAVIGGLVLIARRPIVVVPILSALVILGVVIPWLTGRSRKN